MGWRDWLDKAGPLFDVGADIIVQKNPARLISNAFDSVKGNNSNIVPYEIVTRDSIRTKRR